MFISYDSDRGEYFSDGYTKCPCCEEEVYEEDLLQYIAINSPYEGVADSESGSICKDCVDRLGLVRFEDVLVDSELLEAN